MISVRLAGGLGNQLFQLAAAAMLARRGGGPITVRTGALGRYRTARQLALPQIVDMEKLAATVSDAPHWSERVRLPKLLALSTSKLVFCNDRNLLDLVRSRSCLQHIYLDGYFIESIDQEFFNEAVELINDALVVISASNKDAMDVCAIHIRGGDFLQLGWNLPDLLAYYRSAIKAVRSLSPSTRFVVLTDDQGYAARIMESLAIDYDFGTGGLKDDFTLIRSARHAILSNSTFSIWAGALRRTGAVGLTFAPDFWRPGRPRHIRLATEAVLQLPQ